MSEHLHLPAALYRCRWPGKQLDTIRHWYWCATPTEARRVNRELVKLGWPPVATAPMKLSEGEKRLYQYGEGSSEVTAALHARVVPRMGGHVKACGCLPTYPPAKSVLSSYAVSAPPSATDGWHIYCDALWQKGDTLGQKAP